MACKRIETLAQRPTRTVPRNSDTDWPQGMPTYLNHVPMAPTPGTSSAAPVVAWSEPDESGWRTPLHQSPGASWLQTDTNQGTTLDDASVTEPGADTRQPPERTDDTTGAGQGCGTNLKLCLAIYFHIYIYILSIQQDIIDMLSTAHMKLQIAKQSFTKSSERSSFGQRPSKSSRQVPQVYTPGNSSNQVSKACLPSKSSKQVFQASAWVEDLLGRLAWQTCLV